MSILSGDEMGSMWRKQRERVDDAAAADCEMVACLMVGRRRAEVEVQASEVKEIVLGEEVDWVGEVVSRQSLW
jgi:hypothetical protein